MKVKDVRRQMTEDRRWEETKEDVMFEDKRHNV